MRFLYPLLFFSAFQALGQTSTNVIDSLQDLLSTNLDPSRRAYILDELSYQWFTQDLDSSLAYGIASYGAFQQLDDPKGLSQAATSIGVAYHYLNKWDSAEYYYVESLNVRRESFDTLKTASSLNNLGVMFMDKEDFNEATNYFVQAMKVREDLQDSSGIAVTKFNLGLIFKKQGIYDKAISYYEEVEAYFRKPGKEGSLEVALLNLGSIYNTIGQFDQGLAYNTELKILAESRSSKRNLAKSYVNLGNSFQGLGQLDSGLFYVSKALEFFQEQKDTLNVAHSLSSIAQFQLELGNYAQAVNYSLQLQGLNEKLQNKELFIENQLVLSQAYAKAGNFKSAYESLERSFYQKDSLLNESLNETIADLTMKYESEQKEREISELQVQNQEVELAQQRSNNQRNALLFLAGILVVSAVLLFLLLRVKSRSNTIISQSLFEKETLLREIHHRVKNNLQVISSLLSLQSRYMEDERAQAAVNEGQNRVKSMALIHQKLYQNNNLSGVEALDYIKNLTSALEASYGVNAEQVEINYEVEQLNIDVDTIIPMGLILNELISNTFKHAFPDNRRGELHIGLKEANNSLELVVKDNGVGADPNAEDSDSFGMRMIRSLAMKLEAEVNFDFSKGTQASLAIASYKLV